MKTPSSIAFSITSDYDCIRKKEVFSDLLKVLMVYAHSIIGNSSLKLKKSKSDLAYDLAMEAITRYLENPTDFDPERNPNLVWYLKFSILKRLVSNLKKSKGMQNELLYENDDSTGIKVMNSFAKSNDIHSSIDLSNIIDLINKEISNTPDLLELFELRFIKDYTRAETIQELKITAGEYNNRIRRLDTVRRRVLKSYETEIVL